MALSKIRLGDIVIPYKNKCGNPHLTPYEVSGVNRDKEFFEPSHQVGADTENYQNVPPHFFACNLMHVGRDVVLPIAFNHTDSIKHVSPAYTVFSLKENVGILEEYFFLYLKSDERDRYFWFHTDSSVRDGMSWEDFCDIEIDLPSLDIQQKYVDVYNAMLANQQTYERGLEDLKLSYEALLEEYKRKAERKTVGNILSEIDNRNDKGLITDVRGININKQFMPTVADTNGVNLSKYKIVQKGQFAFSGMQTGRDECIRIAFLEENKPIIISPAYSVFENIDKNVISEYLMMWFSRKESDRLGWFMSDASIRTNLEMDRFYEIEIPIPDIEIQKSIVNIFNCYIERKRINEQLKAQIKDICPILIKGSIEEGGKD